MACLIQMSNYTKACEFLETKAEERLLNAERLCLSWKKVKISFSQKKKSGLLIPLGNCFETYLSEHSSISFGTTVICVRIVMFK